jgi:hypothetical protein
MNPLINAYNYKISQLQEQISYLLRENNNIIRLFEDTPSVPTERLDELFPGWRQWGFDEDLIRKYVTPGGGLTPAGRYLADFWDMLLSIQPGTLTDHMGDFEKIKSLILQMYRYLHAFSPNQLTSFLQRYKLLNVSGPEFYRNINNIANNAEALRKFLSDIIKTVNPGFFGQIMNRINSRRGFASTRLLAIIAALVAAGVAIEIILQYLDSAAGQNEEWPDDLLGNEPENFDPQGPTPTTEPSSVTPQTPSFPSEIPSTTPNQGTPPWQSRPELPY